LASIIHIAETAALLALAYSIGWAVGYVARRLAARSRPAVAAVIPAERLAAAKGEHADALVKAPVVVEVNTAPPPVAPVLPAETLLAIGELGKVAVPDPVPAAVLAASSVDLLSGVDAPVATAAIEALKAIATDRPLQPPEEPPALPAATATPASRPGEAWSGEIHGHAAARHDAVLLAAAEPEPEPVAPPELPPPAVPDPVDTDEDAAMRAIEGGWSRRAARALPDRPELIGVTEAVAAAQTAVEQVIAKLEDDPASDATPKP
jgi:hypothetical protein